ncbi:MAG TPA: hypothetical protein VIH87_13905 [Methylocella sp.]
MRLGFIANPPPMVSRRSTSAQGMRIFATNIRTLLAGQEEYDGDRLALA